MMARSEMETPMCWSVLRPEQRIKRVEQELDMSSANAQLQSPLFGLPAEIRLLIHEQLFGTGTVHLTSRNQWPRRKHRTVSYLRDDPDSDNDDNEDDDNDDDDEEDFIYSPPLTLSYAICQHPDDWDSTYYRSKRPPLCPVKYGHDNVIAPYNHRHADCITPSKHFNHNKYVLKCSHLPLGKTTKSCGLCIAEEAHLANVYGPPETGLRKVHANSAFDLAILSTCKKVYREARSLPFTLYTFDAGTPAGLLDFTTKFLVPFQIAALETVHLSSSIRMYPTVFLALLRVLPNLKTVRVSFLSAVFDEGYDKEWQKFFRRNIIKSAEIIFDYNCNDCVDGCLSTCVNGQYNKDAAERAERFLTSSSAEEARSASGVDVTGTASQDHDPSPDESSDEQYFIDINPFIEATSF